MRILLAGASGTVGTAVLMALLAADYEVVVVGRKPELSLEHTLQPQLWPKVQVPTAQELLEPRSLSRVRYIQHDLVDSPLDGKVTGPFDAVISCLGSRRGGIAESAHVEFTANKTVLACALSQPACTRFLLISAICVQRPRLEFQRQKLLFEAALQKSGMPFTIVRPTAYFKSLSGQVERLRAGKPFLIFGNGELTACKPIALSDLATFTLQALEACHFQNTMLPIGGPGPAITPRKQGEMLAQALGVTPQFRSINPDWFLRASKAMDAIANVSFGRFATTSIDTAEFLRIAHYYATESMLLWDTEAGCYDAEATPEFGSITLEAHYDALAQTLSGSGLHRSHRLFK